MAEYTRQSQERRDQVLKDHKAFYEGGFVSPVEVFSPKGLEFPIVYDWGSAGTLPIPEFRVYAQQFLGLLAVILSTHTLITAENALTVKCWVENTCQRLDLILWVDLHLPRDSPGLAEHERTLHSIGMTMSWALRKLFSDLKPIFWDFGPDKDRFKLWVEYPGNMTVAGFVRALTQPNMLWSKSPARIDWLNRGTAMPRGDASRIHPGRSR